MYVCTSVHVFIPVSVNVYVCIFLHPGVPQQTLPDIGITTNFVIMFPIFLYPLGTIADVTSRHY